MQIAHWLQRWNGGFFSLRRYFSCSDLSSPVFICTSMRKIIAAIGVIVIAALVCLWVVQRKELGKLQERFKHFNGPKPGTGCVAR